MSRMEKGCRVTASLFLVLLLLNVFPVVILGNSPHTWNGETTRIDKSQNIIANTPHAPIIINGDANFSATALAEGWTGNGSQQNPYVIENLDITSSFDPDSSINITDTRAYYIIRGCILTGPSATPSYGIYLENSTNGRIINNVIADFAHGLYVSTVCNGLVVSHNNISYNSYGIYWSGSDYPNITHNTCSNNFFDGIYIENSGALLGPITDNTCNNNDRHGIFLNQTDGMLMTDNICNENSQYGFYLNWSSSNWIENNTSIENNYGLFTNNSEINEIHWNVFANSTTADGNALGAMTSYRYNYWSDYTGSDAGGDGYGDTPHIIGPIDVDSSPLMFPPFPVEWAQPIVDQQIEFGSDFQYGIPVICPAPYNLGINDSTNFWLDLETIYGSTTLAVGDYPIAASATNIYGYHTDAIFTVFVRDTTPPSLTHPSDFSYREDEHPDYMLEWTMSDLSPLTFQLLRNGIEVTSYDVPITPIFFSSNLEDMGPGVYNYTMVAEDIWGNVATDMVLITITPVPFLEVMLPWVIVISVVAVIVIVIVMLLRKRKPKK